MNLMDRLFGGLTKLKITAMDGEKPAGEPFVVMFNPESYSESFSAEYITERPVGGGKEKRKFVRTNPQELSLTLIIDGTGVSGSEVIPVAALLKKTDTVFTKVNNFLKLAWYPGTNTNTPSRLCVEWGNLKFYCFLSKVTINYPLIDSDGSPLRAELDVTFKGDAELNEDEYTQRFTDEGVSEAEGSDDGIVISIT